MTTNAVGALQVLSTPKVDVLPDSSSEENIVENIPPG